MPEQAEPRHVGDRVGLERSDGVRGRAVQLDHGVDGCLERARGRDSVPLCLQHEARTERLREEEDVARARPGLRPDPLRMHQADDREPVLRLGVANRVATRENRASSTNALLGPGEHLAEHLDRKLLRKGGDRERQERRAAHRVHVVQRVRRGDGAERSRIVDERREEVDREHDRPLVVQAVHRRIVGRIETDEQILGVGRDEPCEKRLETRGRVLRRAPSGARERREPDGLHADTVRKEIAPDDPKNPAESSIPFPSPPDTRPPPPRRPHYLTGETSSPVDPLPLAVHRSIVAGLRASESPYGHVAASLPGVDP